MTESDSNLPDWMYGVLFFLVCLSSAWVAVDVLRLLEGSPSAIIIAPVAAIFTFYMAGNLVIFLVDGTIPTFEVHAKEGDNE